MATPRLCSIPGCGKPAKTRGWCFTHYARWYRHGDPLGGRTLRLCSIPGCGRKHSSRGWCLVHWKRWKRHGDPLAGRTFIGTPLRYFRGTVLTYDGDECLVWPFSRSTAGYGYLCDGGKSFLVSRLVCEAVYGEPPTPKHEAAHSCGNGHLGCVTKIHLRWATHTENIADTIRHGMLAQGERHYSAKLTNAQAEQIRDLKGTMTQRGIAARFGISRQGVSRIHLRKTYKLI